MPRGRVGGGRGGAGRAGRRTGRGRSRGGGSVEQFLGPHNGRQAGAAANAEAGAEFNPGIRQIRGQVKGSSKREQDVGSWYRQLAADYGAAEQAGSAALKSTQDATARQLAEASSRAGAEQAELAAGDAKTSALLGSDLKDTAGLSKIAMAGSAAERSRVAINAPAAQEQANFIGRVGQDKAASTLRGIEARKEERDRRDKLLSDLEGARKDKGAARVAAKEKIRESDRSYSSDLKQMALATKEARSAEQQAAADQTLAQIESRRQAEQDAISTRQEQERISISRRNAKTGERSQRASARGDKGGLTPTQRRAAKREQKGAVITAANLYKAAKKPPKTAAQWAAFVQLVAAEEGIDPVAAQGAVEKLRGAIASRAETRSRRMHQGRIPGH